MTNIAYHAQLHVTAQEKEGEAPHSRGSHRGRGKSKGRTAIQRGKQTSSPEEKGERKKKTVPRKLLRRKNSSERTKVMFRLGGGKRRLSPDGRVKGGTNDRGSAKT